jgi:YbgC/YbaW family acyl-CoA thioester hydrolase
MGHEHRLTVRTYECDANGHVNNATYLNYLEVARVAYLRAVGTSYRELKDRGLALVIVRIAIDYRGEARMEDPLIVETVPIRKRLTGGTFRQRVLREEESGARTLLAEAEVGWVCIDARRKPTRLPAPLDALEVEGVDA